MVKKHLDWADAELQDHSRKKLQILREYFSSYLEIRCQLPQQEHFRFAVVDGFAGGGRYRDGTSGSPLVFIEELGRAAASVNVKRAAQGMGGVAIECLLILNESDVDALEILKANVAPLQAATNVALAKVHLRVDYINEEFETAYPRIKLLLQHGRFRNVLFNLDQYGHKQVDRATISDIMCSYPSVEIFFTFAVQSLLSFLQKSNPVQLANQLGHVGLIGSDLEALDDALMSKQDWLGAVERMVFDEFKSCAVFHSPFSIHNPNGWRYWLIHFANSYRGRQAYNDVLHRNSSSQAHFGRSGLNMLSYDPEHEGGTLYLFDVSGRRTAKLQLNDDIPRFISESGDAILVSDFYESIYNATPAHSDDIHSAIIENPDIEVITPAGGERRKAKTIGVNDTLKLRGQKSFFPMFFGANQIAKK